ncbi:MAG: V-type ATP synthase subunit D [Chlamydiales bacterium]|nr:V-type ATP synthase subunit D [Chlamydiales bacterium]
MAQIKLTKTELRSQQVRLDQLKKYLPTLQLKKALLQVEVFQAQQEIEDLTIHFGRMEERVKRFSVLLSDKNASDLFSAVTVVEVKKRVENIAGVEIPYFEEVVFHEPTYSLFDTPVWMEPATEGVRELINIREKIRIAREKKTALENELREVSIRVNLFEKILIPRAQENIKKIKIFLGDVLLAAVSQAKVSKQKILKKKAASS